MLTLIRNRSVVEKSALRYVAGVTIVLRNVPPELHQKLKAMAKLHNRTLSEEVIAILKESAREKSYRRFTSPRILSS